MEKIEKQVKKKKFWSIKRKSCSITSFF